MSVNIVFLTILLSLCGIIVCSSSIHVDTISSSSHTLSDAYHDPLSAESTSSSLLADNAAAAALLVVGRAVPHPHAAINMENGAGTILAQTSSTVSISTSRAGAHTSDDGGKHAGTAKTNAKVRAKIAKLSKRMRKRRAAARKLGKKRNKRSKGRGKSGRKVYRHKGKKNKGWKKLLKSRLAGQPQKLARPFRQPIVVPLPKSQFGIPSELDEECVMCQYLVQRIQSGIYEKLVKNPTAGDNAVFGGSPDLNAATLVQAAKNQNLQKLGIANSNQPGSVSGIPGMGALGSNIPVPAVMAAASVGGPFAGGPSTGAGSMGAQHEMLIKKTNSVLRRRPGGRGIVRIVAEDVTRGICHTDKMPELFYPYCQRFKSAGIWRSVKKGLFFNFPTASVCLEAGMCGKKSYVAGKGAVHLPKTSNKYNSMRGLCGLKGGIHERSRVKELYCTTSS